MLTVIVTLLVIQSFAAYEAIGQSTSEPNIKQDKKVSIKDFAWIAGHWRGEAMGGHFEETWNPPLGNSMIGMFKLVKDREIVFSELVMLSEIDGKLAMRVKHFDKKFVGWEDKSKFMEFPFVEVDSQRAVFQGLVIKRISPNRLVTEVQVNQSGSVKTISFDASRVPVERTIDRSK